jgi:WD40 repeat protein
VGGDDTPLQHRHSTAVYQLAFSRHGSRLATSAVRATEPWLREIKVWDTASGRPCLEKTIPGAQFHGGLALTADGHRLAVDYNTMEKDGRTVRLKGAGIQVWDVPDRPSTEPSAARWSFAGPQSLIRALAFSPDGRYLAASGHEPGVFIWSLTTGKPLHARPLEGQAYQLAFNPDGTRLAAVNRREVKVWDVVSGQESIVPRGAPPAQTDMGFNPQVAWSGDGRRLAAGFHNRTVAVWNADDDRAAVQAPEAVQARAFAWHLELAARGLEEKLPGLFDFHWRYIRDAEPPDAPLRRRRDELRASRGE